MRSRLLRAIAASLLALALGLALPHSGMAREPGGGHTTSGSAGEHHAGKAGGMKQGTDRARRAGTVNPKHQGGASSRNGSSPKKPPQGSGSPGKRGPKPAAGVARDDEGRIARSARQKAAFRQSHPCPSTGKTSGPCPGYVVDHRVPLKRGGADAPHNMQWQSQQAAQAKDRRE